MSAAVDVLAVLDRAFGAADEHYLDLRSSDDKPLGPAYDRSCRYLKEHRKARAAVAELIEVAGSVSDAAVAHYGDAMGLHLALAATGGLNERLAAALAGVKGGAA